MTGMKTKPQVREIEKW